MNKKILASSLLSASLLTSNIAFAETAPNWDFIQASYVSMDIDEIDELDFTGFDISGSKLVSDNIFIAANYSALSDDYSSVSVDTDTYGIGIGYRYGLNSTTDALAILSVEGVSVKASFEGSSEKVDDTGFGLTAGIRSMVTEQVELTGTVKYVNIDSESDTAFSVNAFYHFNSQFSIGAGYSISSDLSGYNLSARYSF